MRMRLLIILFIVGCAERSVKMGSDDADMSYAESADTGIMSSEGADDAAEEPSHWMLSGSLDIQDGELNPLLSHVQVSIVGPSGTVLCSDGVGIRQALRVEDLPDDDLQIWWTVALADVAPDSCLVGSVPDVVPDSLNLGLGPLHPEVEAVMGDSLESLGGDEMVVRSIFASMYDHASVWVFGVAVTESSDDGAIGGAPAEGVLVSQGRWKFQGLYGFPY